MRIRDIKQEARNSLNKRWGFAVLLTLITTVINLIPPAVQSFWGGHFLTNEGPPPTARFVSWVLTAALFPVLYGFYNTFLEMNRGKTVTLSNLFQGFIENRYFKIVGLYLLTFVYTLLWSILFIIPGIIKAIAYTQVYFILKDNPEIGLNAAITKSRELMNGYKWKYFLLGLSFIGWGILSLLTIGIGFLWLVPYISASNAAFYQSLIGDKGTGTSSQL